MGAFEIAARAVGTLPQRGGVSARSALTIHRGAARPPRRWLDGMPDRVRDHLTYRAVERLEPVVQHHVIDGLLAPAY